MTPEARPRGAIGQSAFGSALGTTPKSLASVGPSLTTNHTDGSLHCAWGCSSVGRAQGWQSWGQGFEPPQLHQFFSRGYGAGRNPLFLPGCVGVASGLVKPIDRCLVCARYQVSIDIHRHLDGVMTELVLDVDH